MLACFAVLATGERQLPSRSPELGCLGLPGSDAGHPDVRFRGSPISSLPLVGERSSSAGESVDLVPILPVRGPASCMNSIAAIPSRAAPIRRAFVIEARVLILLLQVFKDQGAMHSPRNQPAEEARPIDVRTYFASHPAACIVSCAVSPSTPSSKYSRLRWTMVGTDTVMQAAVRGTR